MNVLNPLEIDLEKTTLIEASAGTGKTYTITTLFARLVAGGWPVEKLLVVTFTEAAAAELKVRIRKRLSGLLNDIQDADAASDLQNRQNKKGAVRLHSTDDLAGFFLGIENRPLISKRLRHAVNCFDTASIMTIHSFCLKTLKEHAFESASTFDVELMPDSTTFLKQVCCDFFLSYVNDLDPLFLKYLAVKKSDPDSFASGFKGIVSRKDLAVIPLNIEFKQLFDDYRKTLGRIHGILLHETDEIARILKDHTGLDHRSYSRKNVPRWLQNSLDRLAEEGEHTLVDMGERGDDLYKFTLARLREKTAPGETPPVHELFDLCDRLREFYDEFKNNLISIKIKFIDFFNGELEKMKKEKSACFFDDLINDLASALKKEHSGVLIKSVRNQYSACLIDEFQDTDVLQYDIFRKFFGSKGMPFFMIGDPKQSIYAFRGADIFAYLKASKDCEQRFTLDKNYRSSPLLVNGINQVFSSAGSPFVFDQILFSKVSTPDDAVDSLYEGDLPAAPLQFLFISRTDSDRDGPENFINKASAFKRIPEILAEDIINLLNSGRTLKRKNKNGDMDITCISAADIAVLVRTNEQAASVQKSLSGRGIPCILSRSGSVFDSEHAVDLYRILSALYQPGDRGLIRAALCTSVFGFTQKNLMDLNQNQEQFYFWLSRFHQLKTIWENRGFVGMIMPLFHSEEGFLTPKPGLDERAMTNFSHLVELISQAELKQHFTPYYLLKWYEKQLSKESRDEYSDELRLETDKAAVKIVTVHKSKGMEYPVVYLPYVWEGVKRVSNETVIYHDPEKDHQLTLDLGSDNIDRAVEYSLTEERAEQRRLLYVALTRASAMCRIIWGGFSSVETSALGAVIHKGDCRDDDGMLDDLEILQKEAAGSIHIDTCSINASASFEKQEILSVPELDCTVLTRQVEADWKRASFSSITGSGGRPKDVRDQQKKEIEAVHGGGRVITLETFPRGAGTGSFFHEVFEQIDFTAGKTSIEDIVNQKLYQYALSEPGIKNAAVNSIHEVLDTQLKSDMDNFSLRQIASGDRFNELEFLFDVKDFVMDRLIKVFEKADSPIRNSGYLKMIETLSINSFKGFMKGFIDLVVRHNRRWYIVDYKSNWLGNSYEKYGSSEMLAAMGEHHYFLQYCFYTIALHRYLGLRLRDYDYDDHFGGVFYLFLRGMHPDYGSKLGVFYDRPLKSVIELLSDMM